MKRERSPWLWLQWGLMFQPSTTESLVPRHPACPGVHTQSAACVPRRAAVTYRKGEVLTPLNVRPYDLVFMQTFSGCHLDLPWVATVRAELGPSKIHTLEAPVPSASESNHTWTWGL